MAEKLDFISIASSRQETLLHVLEVAKRLKKQRKETGQNDLLASGGGGKVLACIYEKPSLRTRVSFEMAMFQLGGNAIYISPNEIGLGTRESAPDVARVLSGMVDGIMARVFEHQKILELAEHALVPVINGLSDYSHPCQAMADIMTIEEHFGKLAGLTLAYIGDGNNVARSLMAACACFNMKFRMAAPPGYGLEKELPGLDFAITPEPRDALRNADVIYTDTWVSMGQEAEKEKRMAAFQPYQVNAELLKAASRHAVVMHCLPANRGLEITDEVIDGPRSVVFQEAENRLHFQKGLLAVLLCGA
ncbi:MAG: ornithine carbamoyltransferase [Phycisphaerales bacterium]|nr:ornithine carbamoyltransferase [Phycisphaerales bacterium]